MRRIYKYVLNSSDEVQNVATTQGAEFLTAQSQPGVGLCVWAVVDPDAPVVIRKVHILVTGGMAHEKGTMQYLGTVLTAGAFMVFHVFIEPEPK